MIEIILTATGSADLSAFTYQCFGAFATLALPYVNTLPVYPTIAELHPLLGQVLYILLIQKSHSN